MSKQTKRKITVELPKNKDVVRPSVFERLGTKNLKSSSKKSEYCRQWAQNGNCAYGKSCKFASTHTLVSPSKRAANKDSDQKRLLKDDPKSRLHSTVVVRSDRSPGEIDNWDQNDLEYADTDVLEKRRQQLQRELDLQLKMDGKDKKKKEASSSSSSRSSSSSSVSSSTSDGSSSSTSSDRNARKKEKKSKLKRNCSSSTDGEVTSKRKYTKDDTSKRDKSENKKTINKKDDRLAKKTPIKKKTTKSTLGRKSFSPGRKTGGTPPIQLKALSKVYGSSKHGKSPQRRDRNKSVSPSPNKDRDRDRGKDRDKERDRERDRDRNRGRSRSRRGRSRSLRRHRSHSKDIRRKDSSERIRPNSPKKQIRRDASPDRNRKTSESKDRDRNRDHKDKSLEKRKDKHEDKDRLDRKEKIDRGRDRTKDLKKDDSSKRSKGGRERGSGRSGKEPDKGLAKPNKPMERLLPRPEERLAALAAITNKVLDVDKVSTTSKDRQDSERGNRKQDRERGNKRGERISSLDRDPGDYDTERQYDRSRPIEDYNRVEDGYSDGPREDDRSPGYSRDRRYEPGYDLAGPQRSYPEGDDRMYMGDHRGYDERRRDRSWEGRAGGSMDRERPYMHPRKEWDGEEYRPGGEWGRERHWPMHEPPLREWGDKDPDMEGWHHRGPGPHGRPRGQEEYGRNMRKDRGDKRRLPPRPEPEAVVETPPVVAPPPARTTDAEEDKPIPDDLSEISDDPDDILNREDMVEQPVDEESQASQALPEDNTFKPDTSENQSTQDTSGAGDDKESQEGKDDEVVSNLDFEEISDGELEEERTRGLGDALGVDWASLVADVQRRDVEAPIGSALSRWNPQRVLAKLGLSVEMAGTETVQAILDANTEEQRNEENANNEEKLQGVSVKDIHPVAAIQVAIKKRALERAALFGTGCEIRRALSGRRDLAVRRHLCRLPVAERVAPPRHSPHRSLFHAARALLMQQPLPA